MKFSIPRPYVTIVGGIQPSKLYKLFAKDRDTSGFSFRILFANSDNKMANPDIEFIFPPETMASYQNHIRKIFDCLPVTDHYQIPKKCVLSNEAVQIYKRWKEEMISKVNSMDEVRERGICSGILGKISEYTLKFAGILTVSDRAFSIDDQNPSDGFKDEEIISEEVMKRALKLSDYFYNSAWEVYNQVDKSLTAPAKVLIAASILRQKGSYTDIAHAPFIKKKDQNINKELYDL